MSLVNHHDSEINIALAAWPLVQSWRGRTTVIVVVLPAESQTTLTTRQLILDA